MMKISGSLLGSSVEVEADEWIPLKVSWWPRRQVQPLYVRISNTRGRGEIEFKLDPEGGAMFQFILIEEPPVDERLVVEPALEGGREIPVFDLTPWRGSGNLEGAVMSLELEMSLSRSEHALSVCFSDEEPSVVVSSGPVEFGTSADGDLVRITAKMPSMA